MRTTDEWIGKTPTSEQLREYLLAHYRYEPDTGLFWRRSRTGPNVKMDRPAGGLKNRYRFIRVAGKKYAAHRLAWLYVHGKWPSGVIDHINGEPADNRLINLRDVTRYQNCINRKVYSSNTSGFRGVSWHAASNSWVARISVNGMDFHLGCFKTPEEAANRYREAAQVLHRGLTREDSHA